MSKHKSTALAIDQTSHRVSLVKVLEKKIIGLCYPYVLVSANKNYNLSELKIKLLKKEMKINTTTTLSRLRRQFSAEESDSTAKQQLTSLSDLNNSPTFDVNKCNILNGGYVILDYNFELNIDEPKCKCKYPNIFHGEFCDKPNPFFCNGDKNLIPYYNNKTARFECKQLLPLQINEQKTANNIYFYPYRSFDKNDNKNSSTVFEEKINTPKCFYISSALSETQSEVNINIQNNNQIFYDKLKRITMLG